MSIVYRIFHRYKGNSEQVFKSEYPNDVHNIAKIYRDNFEQSPESYHHGLSRVKREIPLDEFIEKIAATTGPIRYKRI